MDAPPSNICWKAPVQTRRIAKNLFPRSQGTGRKNVRKTRTQVGRAAEDRIMAPMTRTQTRAYGVLNPSTRQSLLEAMPARVCLARVQPRFAVRNDPPPPPPRLAHGCGGCGSAPDAERHAHRKPIPRSVAIRHAAPAPSVSLIRSDPPPPASPVEDFVRHPLSPPSPKAGKVSGALLRA